MTGLLSQLREKVFPYMYLNTWKCVWTAFKDILFNINAYKTNPIVVLFADKYGNLPHSLRYWQTYDNCLDVEWMVTEGVVPKLFRYDFNKHYKYHYEVKNDDGTLIPGHVDILDDTFTIKERMQRYFCRLLWLNRNCAYGYSYEVSGIDYNTMDMEIITNTKHERVVYEGESEYSTWTKDASGIPVTTTHHYTGGYFALKFEIPWYCFGKKFDFDIYLGWKINPSLERGRTTKAMLAMRVSPFHSWKWED